MKKTITFVSILAALGSSGCSLIVDGAIQDRDTGVVRMDGGDVGTVQPDSAVRADAGDAETPPVDSGIDAAVVMPDAVVVDAFIPPPPCRGGDGGFITDGTQCTLVGSTDPAICLGGRCVVSSCGDGVIDTRLDGNGAPLEDCDDGNDATGDGCEPTSCRYTCTTNNNCFDMSPCTTETCDTATHLCVRTNNTNACGTGSTGMCRTGVCVPAGCGNSTREGAEQCDDGNQTAGDGCESDCRFTCDEDADCSDNDPCTGVETCTIATHICVNPPDVNCNDSNDCTTDSCNQADGMCIHDSSPVDRDGDGHPVTGSCTGADDCDDMNASVAPGLAEVCGNSIDDDCNGATSDSTQTTYYPDCDGDGYASSSAPSRLACRSSELGAPPCVAGGRWITRAPMTAADTDCNDTNGAVFPGQTRYFVGPDNRGSFDYDCSATVQREFGFSATASTASCSLFFGLGPFSTRLCFSRTLYQTPSEPVCGSTVTSYSCGGTSCSRQANTMQRVGCH